MAYLTGRGARVTAHAATQRQIDRGGGSGPGSAAYPVRLQRGHQPGRGAPDWLRVRDIHHNNIRKLTHDELHAQLGHVSCTCTCSLQK